MAAANRSDNQPHSRSGILKDKHKSSDKDEASQSEDLNSCQWEQCHCELAGCDSCVAERLAMIDNDEHICSADYVTEKIKAFGPPPNIRTAEDAATVRLFVSCCSKKAFATDRDDINKTIVIRGPLGISDRLFIYWFHRAIADSTIDGRTQFSYASAIAVLQFAYMVQKDPSVLTVKGPPRLLHEQVTKSLRKANILYDTFYKGQAINLGPEDTLKASEDLGLKLLFQEDVYSHCPEVMLRYIISLNQKQILMIYRHKPYKVVSVSVTADPEVLCVFDSQLHRSTIDDEFGAMVFGSEKETAGEMIRQLEIRLLPYQGKVSILLLDL